MEKNSIKPTIKVFVLTIVTFGLYGAYWIMSNLYKEPDVTADETEKNAAYTSRAATAAFLVRNDLH